MPRRLSGQVVDAIARPAEGNAVVWDTQVVGLGIRVTAADRRSFVLRYVLAGRERRMTLGEYPALSVTAARDLATKLKGRIAHGDDPLERRREDREAPDVRQLCADYLERHAEPHKRVSSVASDRSLIDRHIDPRLGARRVAHVTRRDIEALHASLAAKPYQANRLLALLSKMFTLAARWGWRTDNPVKGVQRFPEQRRERWLTRDEVRRLVDVLSRSDNKRAARAVLLLLLTGARRSEVLRMEWSHVDLAQGTWTKPSAHTKQKKAEHIPLSKYALALLEQMKADAEGEAAGGEIGASAMPPSRFVFPGDANDSPLTDIKKAWRQFADGAALKGFRLHDLRHTFASHLVSEGHSLPVVGRLMGHTQPATTHRYAHLANTPLRAAADVFGVIASGASPVRSKRETKHGAVTTTAKKAQVKLGRPTP